MLQSRLTFFLLLAATAASAQFTDVINSNRPGESMSAFSVGKTVIQAESGVYYTHENYDEADYKSSDVGMDLDLRYGAFFEQLELIMNLQYQYDKYKQPQPLGDGTLSGMRQMVFGGKYLIYDPNKNYERKPNLYSWKANHSFHWHDFVPAVAVYGGFNIDLFHDPFVPSDNPKFSPKLFAITQNQFGKWVFVTNIGADKLASKYMSIDYVLTLTRGLNERWSAFIEFQGFNGDYYKDTLFRGGAAFLLKENFQVDASLGANTKDNPSLFTAGFGIAWRFDANHEDVMLRAPKEKEDKKSKADKKKEKEAKKRKDAVEGTDTK